MSIFKKILYEVFKPKLKELMSLKNIHRGEDCYIFGDGSSIKSYDLEKFSDKAALISSFLFFHKDVEKLNIKKYGIIVEPFYFYPYFKSKTTNGYWKNIIQERYQEVIDKNPETQFLMNLSNYPTLSKKNNVKYVFHRIPDFPPTVDGTFLDRSLLAGSFSANVAMAIYFGFKNIYLVGFDYLDKNPTLGHWYEYGNGIPANLKGNHQKSFISWASKHANLFYVSPASSAKFIPSITYQELTGSEAKYRSHTEILTYRDINILNKWPNYNGHLVQNEN